MRGERLGTAGCGGHVEHGSAAAHIFLEHAGVRAAGLSRHDHERHRRGLLELHGLGRKLGNNVDRRAAECRRRLAQGNRAGRRDRRPDRRRCRRRSSLSSLIREVDRVVKSVLVAP